MVNPRGQVPAVVDLRARVGLGRIEVGREARVLVMAGPGGAAGLLVEAVCEVLTLATGDVQPVGGRAADGHEAIHGIGRVDGRLVLMLDLDRLLL